MQSQSLYLMNFQRVFSFYNLREQGVNYIKKLAFSMKNDIKSKINLDSMWH